MTMCLFRAHPPIDCLAEALGLVIGGRVHDTPGFDRRHVLGSCRLRRVRLAGLATGAAQAQVVTEFSAGITAFASLISSRRARMAICGSRNSRPTRSGGSPRPAWSPSSAPGSPPTRACNGITAGPDGNLWFTEFALDRIGRITPAGVVTEFSAGITAGAHPMASRRARTAICGSRKGWRPDRADHPGRRGHRVHAGITAGATLRGIAAGRTATCGSRNRRQQDRPDHPGRRDHRVLAGIHLQRGPSASPRARTATCGSPTQVTTRSGASPPAGVVTEFAPESTARCRVHQSAGPDGNLWFTGTGAGNRVGRITPAGVVTEFSAGISATAGPHGHRCGPGRQSVVHRV